MDLLPLTDPYASVWVALYEPLILEWWSSQGFKNLENILVGRGDRPVVRSPFLPSIFAWHQALAARGGRPSPDPTRRKEIRDIFARPDLTPELMIQLLDKLEVRPIVDPGPVLRRELSPIGIAHMFRQLYFDAGAGVGPVENVLAISPHETLEVVEKRTRRRTFERIEEFGLETTTESSIEEQIQDEVAENVQSSLSRDISVGIATEASGSIGVVSGSASANVDLSQSTTQAREFTKRHMLTKTKRAAQTVRRTQKLTIKTQEEVGEEFTSRRVIRNETAEPVNFALRRVQRKIRIKLQEMGPRLVWQLYLCHPGRDLLKSRLVMFRESDPITDPTLVPNAPPRPKAADETGMATVKPVSGTLTLRLPKYEDRDFKALIVHEVTDAAPEKDAVPPAVTGSGAPVNLEANPIEYKIPVQPGTADQILVSYTVQYEPSAAELNRWTQAVAAARAEYEQSRLEEQFERGKRMIDARRRVPLRPAADLRDEERYEILRRMVQEGFGKRPGAQDPAPVEIEMFHRYFELGSMFYYVHPSWWRPRYRPSGDDYEITDESQPAAFGSSLGWVLQMDGDRRRNEFLNSPWVRVCVPVRPGWERDACVWLSEHIEGKRGFSLEPKSPTGKLVADLEKKRGKEKSALPGPDYVTLDGQVAPDAQDAANTWPVVDEFEILEPTEGFVIERLNVNP